MEETLIRFNPHWKKKIEVEGYLREEYLEKILEKLNGKEILFLTGMRRIGKTTLIKQTISHLINEKKVPPEKILFLSGDNIVFSDKTIFEIIDAYRKINEIKHDEPFYLFIDEVNYLKDFNQQLKNLYDSWNLKILCSSSNAGYLNDKKAFLTGRTTTIEVYPLSYAEFLEFRGLKVPKHDASLNRKYFEEYLKHGGIPQYVIKQDPQYLMDVANSIIEKDIILHYKIRDEGTIKELFRLLCSRVGKPVSYNKLSKILNAKFETVRKYLTYFEKTYLFFSCERFSKSRNESMTSPRKFYVIDTGLKNIVSPFEKGPSFENLVFINLLKNRKPFENVNYYLKNGIEIDFITKRYLIEAKYGDSKLTEKQSQLFNKIKRKNKKIVKSYKDVEKLGNNGRLR